ncbi:MAG: D-glycero-beta-D-manno-heptose 1,7-bisphosphate 7-phosphatase [Desulfuromonadaceae bacterium]|nr:D-glycero-beta-D-manno-heptose 1,7-bisphosphate 7-phosphatase [Desulfuromonadaceae bacterium]
MSRSAVFLDRDGTINEEVDYLYRPQDLVFLPGVAAAIRRLNEAGLLVVVVTNQSGVARGYYAEADVCRLHQVMADQLARQGARIDAFYYCPHHPEKGNPPYVGPCSCRKGAPGMLMQAATDLGIDLTSSFMVGDKWVDVEAGRAAGASSLLVLTGHGRKTKDALGEDFEGVPVCDNLSDAVDRILGPSC